MSQPESLVCGQKCIDMANRNSDLHRLAIPMATSASAKRSHLVWQHVITGFVAVTSASASDRNAIRQAERVFKRGSVNNS